MADGFRKMRIITKMRKFMIVLVDENSINVAILGSDAKNPSKILRSSSDWYN